MDEVGGDVLGEFVTLVNLKSWLQPCIYECLIILSVILMFADINGNVV